MDQGATQAIPIFAAQTRHPALKAMIPQASSMATIPKRASVKDPRALYCRYLKRITAHLMNVLTALTMPVDQLAYFDESEEGRLPLDEERLFHLRWLAEPLIGPPPSLVADPGVTGGSRGSGRHSAPTLAQRLFQQRGQAPPGQLPVSPL